jgi:hypothetical protein
VIDLERPVIVKEIGIKPFHSHPNVVLQLTTDDYGACLLVVPFVTQSVLRQRQISAFGTARDVVVLAPRLGPVRDHEFGRAFQSHADNLAFRDSKVVD